MEKKQILQVALQQLNDYLGSELNRPASAMSFSLVKQVLDDREVITLNGGDAGCQYTVLVQAWAPQKDINALISQIKSMPGKAILFADFVNPVMAEKFRQRSIPFVDCAGNMSLRDQPLQFIRQRQKNIQIKRKTSTGPCIQSGRA